jgi:putative transposase
MARPLRLQYPGALFHVISRGDAKQRIFVNDNDRTLFVNLLGESVKRFEWILFAYAIMPNHFHLLVQLTRESLSRGMQWLNGTYALAFNQRHDRVGHVLQGRFKSPPVEKESYLLELIRYIVLNPVRANLVKRPEDDCWTSYRATAGLAPAPSWLAVDDVLLPFGPDRDLARAALRDFVNAAIGEETSLWKELFERCYIGGESWTQEMRDRIAVKPHNSEYPRDQRLIDMPSMPAIVGAVAQTFGVDAARVRHGLERTPRMVAAWIGWNASVLTGQAIGAELRLSAGRVSQLVRSCDLKLDHDAALRDAISTVGRELKIKGLTPTRRR